MPSIHADVSSIAAVSSFETSPARRLPRALGWALAAMVATGLWIGVAKIILLAI